MVAVALDNGDTKRVEVDFVRGERAGAGIPVELCGEDDLQIAGRRPRETIKSDRIVYSFTESASSDRQSVRIAFDRERESEPIELDLEFPQVFTVDAPAPGSSLSRAAPIDMAWSPANPEGQLIVRLEEEIGNGICFETPDPELDLKGSGVRVADSGSWTIPADTAQSMGVTTRCRATLVASRVAPAPYPEVFAPGGFAEAVVRRIVSFTSTP